MLSALDRKIRESFCEASVQYDVLASLHREIGRELTKKLKQIDNAQTILDVGMGTGWFTKRLKNFFSESTVVGMDFASGMIAQAQKQDSDFIIVQGNANALPFRNNSIDLITSNLAYQWIGDLSSGFKQCHNVLSSDGKLILTMFGYETLHELFDSLKKGLNDSKQLPIVRLAKQDDIKDALNAAGFSNIHIDFEHIQVRFPDMMALIKWIKGIGANALKKDIFIGKDLLKKANDYYDAHYKDRLGIYATFEVIWIEVEK